MMRMVTDDGSVSVSPQMEQQRGPAYLTTGQFAPHALGGRDRPGAVHNARHQAFDMRMQNNRVPASCDLPRPGHTHTILDETTFI